MKIKSALINTALMVVTIAAAIGIGSQAPQLYQKWKGNSRSGNFTEHVANQPQRLTLYGTTTCPYCIKARAYLTQAGIPFNDQVLDKSKIASDLYAKLGENSVPLLVSNGKLVIGFDKKEYDELAKSSKVR